MSSENYQKLFFHVAGTARKFHLTGVFFKNESPSPLRFTRGMLRFDSSGIVPHSQSPSCDVPELPTDGDLQKNFRHEHPEEKTPGSHPAGTLCQRGLTTMPGKTHESKQNQNDRAAKARSVCAELRNAGTLGSIERNFRKHPTPLRAIRLMCIECQGGNRKAPRKCSVCSCPLWTFRMGKKLKINGNTP